MENETSVLPPAPSAAEDLAWIAPVDPPTEPPAGGTDRAKVLKAIGIVTTAVVVGAIGVTTLHSSSSASTTNGQGGPGGLGGPPGQGQTQGQGQGFGGRGFGDRLGGTVSKVSATSLTVSTFRGGAQTVRLTSATVVTVDGATASVSDLTSGEQVFVTTSGSGTSLTATQVTAGQGGFQGGPGGGLGGPPGQQQGSGTQPQAPAGTTGGTANGTTHT